MKIRSAKWTPTINMLLIQCDCGRWIEHRSDRWRVACGCGKRANLGELRDEYAERKRGVASTLAPSSA